MKRFIAIGLSTAAFGVLVSLTPALAQVAGNPGDLHTRTVYMYESGQNPGAGQFALGQSAIVPSFLAPGGSPDCGVVQDFNGRYTSLCGL